MSNLTTLHVIPDDYRSMISSIVKISPNIANYYSAGLYEQEIQECDSVGTDQYICNKLITLMIGELKIMGIDAYDHLDYILEDLDTTSLLLRLRRLFDPRLFCILYNKLTDEMRSDIKGILDVTQSENIAIELLAYLQNRFPMNDDINFILDYADYFISLDVFRYYMLELIAATEAVLNNESTIADNLLPTLTTYINYMNNHRELVKHAIDSIVNFYSDVNKEFIYKKFKIYDLDLLNVDVINELAILFNPDNISEIYHTKLFKHHMETHIHHIDYFLKDNINFPNDSELVLIVSEFYAMAVEKKLDVLTILNSVIEHINFPEELNIKMLSYAKIIAPLTMENQL